MKTLWQEYSRVVYSCLIKVPKESNPVSKLFCHSFLSHGPYLTQPVARPHEANLCPALVRKPEALYVSSIFASFYPRAPWKLDREKISKLMFQAFCQSFNSLDLFYTKYPYIQHVCTLILGILKRYDGCCNENVNSKLNCPVACCSVGLLRLFHDGHVVPQERIVF